MDSCKDLRPICCDKCHDKCDKDNCDNKCDDKCHKDKY